MGRGGRKAIVSLNKDHTVKLTKAFKSWLVENCGVKSDASDNEFRKAAAEALMAGTLTAEKHMELTKEADDEAADKFSKRFDSMVDKIDKAVDMITKAQAGSKEPEVPQTKEAGTSTLEPPAKEAGPSRLSKMISRIGGFADEDGRPAEVRVKEAHESYSTTKSALHYPDHIVYKGRMIPHSNAGELVTQHGRAMSTASDQDKALAGVWAKYQLASVSPRIAGSPQRAWELLSDHEKSLLAYLAEGCEWDDSADEKPRTRKGYPGGIKALIDDSTSGGLEAAPIVFDDQIIQAPLLNGELYPMVTERVLDRGRRVEGVSTLTVTGSWAGVDDTSITLFTTTSYVAAFDTTVFRWEGSVRIGLDFMSDTPIDFGAHITAQYGERLLEDLDDVIATGNGTTQPEGIMNKSGTTDVAFNDTTSLDNYESLRFGVSKAEHKGSAKSSAVFCGTETSYMRAHAIPVGTADARRLGGMDYDSYTWMQRPYKINESLTNAEIFYAIMARYRMYRRKGFTVRTTTEGDTLMRANEMLIIVMARFGGQLERGACAAYTDDAPA